MLKVPDDRQRKDFDSVAMLELARSIEKNGLLHAVVVRQDERTLVAGERRTRAIKEHLAPLSKSFTYNGEVIPPGFIPAIVAYSDDELALEEIELEENVKRKNLTWQEEAQATEKLHNLRQRQLDKKNEELKDGFPPNAAPLEQSIAATALEIHGRSDGDYQGKVRAEVIIAKHLHRPEVAKAKSAKEGLKILQRLERDEKAEQMALTIGKTFTSSQHEVIHGSCLEILTRPEMQGRFDCILTDPPYGMGADSFGDGDGHLRDQGHNYDDSPEAWEKLMVDWAPLSYAACKEQAHAYVFCDPDKFHRLRDLMRLAGWYVFRTPFVNYKVNSGRVPLPDLGPRRQYEICLYAIKGKKHTTGLYSDVIESASDEQMDFGAQKPVELYVDLLKRTCIAGDSVLDCFAGTGPILPAAHALKVKAVAIEQKAPQYGKCLQRLEQLK